MPYLHKRIMECCIKVRIQCHWIKLGSRFTSLKCDSPAADALNQWLLRDIGATKDAKCHWKRTPRKCIFWSFLKGNLPAVLDKASPRLAWDISCKIRSRLRPQKSVDHQIAEREFLQ